MKKLVGILAFAALTAGATLAFAGLNPATGVNGSLHDMNTRSGQDDALGRVCVYCHTPHNTTTDADGDNYPLWNHTLPDTDAWLSYQWATPLNAGLVQDPLAGPSRLCMSCHDGVIAVDQHGPSLAQAGGDVLSGDRAIGGGAKDLTNDHPIGFSWDAAVAARNNGTAEVAVKTDKFVTALNAADVTGTYPVHTRNGKRTIGDVLYGGDIMTCASCHDVHNKENIAPSKNPVGLQYNYYLWADENNSLICLSCHVK